LDRWVWIIGQDCSIIHYFGWLEVDQEYAGTSQGAEPGGNKRIGFYHPTRKAIISKRVSTERGGEKTFNLIALKNVVER
jgi:hypothetical protein